MIDRSVRRRRCGLVPPLLWQKHVGLVCIKTAKSEDAEEHAASSFTLCHTSSIFTRPVARRRCQSPFILVYAVLFQLLLLLQSSEMNLPSDAHVGRAPATWLLHRTNVMYAADSKLHYQFHSRPSLIVTSWYSSGSRRPHRCCSFANNVDNISRGRLDVHEYDP